MTRAADEIDPSWDLDQALIWICSRDLSFVGEASLFRQADERLTWAMFAIDASSWCDVPSEVAERLLRQELGAGRLSARDDLEPIAKEWFREASIVLHLEHVAFKRIVPKTILRQEHVDGTALRRVAFEELRPLFEPTEVMTSFPPPEPEKFMDATAAAETKCQRWLENLMFASPGTRPKPKGEFLIEAQIKFGITGRGFERAWASAKERTKSKWGDAGAPRKNQGE